MPERAFFDTNVLLYAAVPEPQDKSRAAAALIERHFETRSGAVSTQVLQELYAAGTRKLRLPPDLVRAQVEHYCSMDVVEIRPPLILAAIDLHLLRGLFFWDALLVKAAAAGGCSILYSEDLQHGQTIDGVRVHNPFGTQRLHPRQG